MVKIIYKIILLALLMVNLPASAQDLTVKKSPLGRFYRPDTVFYYLDTVNIAKDEVPVKVEYSYPFRNFKIFCSCMDTDEKYILLVGLEDKGFIIDDRKFKSLQLFKTKDFITFVKENTPSFGKHAVYVIEPLKERQYLIHKVANSSIGITGSVR